MWSSLAASPYDLRGFGFDLVAPRRPVALLLIADVKLWSNGGRGIDELAEARRGHLKSCDRVIKKNQGIW